MALTDTASIDCPYCGSPMELLIDRTEGDRQRWTIDCETCCRPIAVRVRWRDGLSVSVDGDG